MNESTTYRGEFDAQTHYTVLLYTFFIIFGLPVNIYTLVDIFRRYRSARSFLLLLHVNLNLTDILVLSIYCMGQIVWQLTFDWPGGGTLCKIARFFDVFAFSASSNIMVCIALYRLYALRYPLWISAVGHSRIPRMLSIAWGMAIVIAIPQLLVWREITAEHDGRNITQCTSYWTELLELRTITDYDFLVMRAYMLVQLLLLFYIPLIILLVCYVLILKDIYSTLHSCDSSNVVYIAEVSRISTCSKLLSGNKGSDGAGSIVSLRALRGQDRFQRAKVRSLRITLLLILTYIVTWLPYNLLSWVAVVDIHLYDRMEVGHFLQCMVVLNSVINPFIYGRCKGARIFFLLCGNSAKDERRCCT